MDNVQKVKQYLDKKTTIQEDKDDYDRKQIENIVDQIEKIPQDLMHWASNLESDKEIEEYYKEIIAGLETALKQVKENIGMK